MRFLCHAMTFGHIETMFCTKAKWKAVYVTPSFDKHHWCFFSVVLKEIRICVWSTWICACVCVHVCTALHYAIDVWNDYSGLLYSPIAIQRIKTKDDKKTGIYFTMKLYNLQVQVCFSYLQFKVTLPQYFLEFDGGMSSADTVMITIKATNVFYGISWSIGDSNNLGWSDDDI